MAGAALTAVENQVSILTGYADTALATAQTAIADLTELDFPYLQSIAVPYSSVDTITPVIATAPVMDTIADDMPDSVAFVAPEKPTRPEWTLPDKPTVDEIVIPPAPTVDLDSFDIPQTFQELAIDDPVFNRALLDWEAIDAIAVSMTTAAFELTVLKIPIDRLKDNVQNGGTGLSPEIEAAIFARGSEREDQQLEDTIDKAMQTWSKRGFSLPDGMLAHSLAELQKEYMNRRIDKSRELEIKQADLEQSNIFKSLEILSNLGIKFLDLRNNYLTQIRDINKALADFGNEYIKVQVLAYTSALEAYKTIIAAHEGIIRANLAKVQVYSEQIRALALQEQISEMKLKVYEQEIRAVLAQVDVFKAEVDAMTAEMTGEKIKIEANSAQIEAWAKKADITIKKFAGEVDMYRATSQQNVSIAELQGRLAETDARVFVASTEQQIRGIEIVEKSVEAAAAMRIEAAKQVAVTTASLATGAMSAVSAHSSLEYGESMALEEA